MEEKSDLSADTKYDASVNLRYIVGKTSVVFENGVRAPVQEFNTAARERTMPSLIARCLKEKDTSGYDYKYLISTGTLRKRGSHSKDPIGPRSAPKEAKKKPTSIVLSMYVIIVIVLIVGAASVVLSAYHGWTFLMMMKKPPVVSVITGIAFVLYSSTAFSAARLFLSRGSKPAAIIFIVTGVFTVLFSVLCTLGVSYEQYKSGNVEKTAEYVENKKAVASSSVLLVERRRQVTSYEESARKAEEEAEYWREKNWKKYDAFTATAKQYRDKIDVANSEIADTSVVEVVAKESVASSDDDSDVYEFIFSVMPWAREDSLKFFMFAVPSVFYDVIAPFALFVVLLLVDALREEDEKQGAAKEEE